MFGAWYLTRRAWHWAGSYYYPVGMVLNIEAGHRFVMSTGGYANGGKYHVHHGGNVMIIVIFYGTWY